MAIIYDFHKSKGELGMRVYSTVFDVAEYFLSKTSMSHKRLQKLVYYAYVWTLTLLNDDEEALDNKLFHGSFEAWVHGPVCPTLYHHYKVYGWDDIPKISNFNKTFASEVLDILNQVWDAYGNYSGNDLEYITHQEQPWINARKGLSPFDSSDADIEDTSIYKFYNKIGQEG